MRIKKGDTVQVLSGNDKGKKGEVLEVIPKTEKRICWKELYVTRSKKRMKEITPLWIYWHLYLDYVHLRL